MQRSSRLLSLLLAAYCSLLGHGVHADDPFSRDDPFSLRAAAASQAGVTRVTAAKLTSRAKTLASPADQHIEAALSSKTAIKVKALPLSQVMRQVGEAHQLPVFPRRRILQKANVNLETPITLDVRGISLRMALKLVLSEAGLDYLVKDEVVQYTTKDDALRQPIKTSYQLADRQGLRYGQIIESLQKRLDEAHSGPMPHPTIKASRANDGDAGLRTLTVTCNYKMHAIVRDYLSKFAGVAPKTAPR